MMQILRLALVGLLLTAGAAVAEEPLATDDDKTLYALGLSMARNINTLELSEKEVAIVEQGFHDGARNQESKVEIGVYGPRIQVLAKERLAKVGEAESKTGADFLAKAEKEKGVKKTASGLLYQEIKAGKGESPKADSKVKVHYHGTLRDGSVFDSSVDRKEPASFALNQVIPCWTEGVQMMKVGGKSKLVCPASLAYKERGAPPKIKPNSPLVFEVELLEIVK
ncbi:MAG: FKBP-type peptidyl-prolyl cis-trans isomerase [Candidatus Binatia bacterium]